MLQALTFIGTRVKSPSFKRADDRKKSKAQEGKELVVKIILAHVPVF